VSISLEGFADPRFAAARDAFAALFDEELETGAAFALEVGGARVIDLWAGAASRETGAPWARDTLVPVFSTTKALTALVMAWLVEQGALDYEQTVASLWPEFAQNGKAEITVAQALSHQAGLPGFRDEIQQSDWFDREGIAARLAAMAPMWPPGTASGYHPITFGFLADEIARRAAGRSVGAILREEFAGPFGLDLWTGLPDSEHGRVAELEKPNAFPEFGKRTPERFAAFIAPWAAPGQRGAANWRRAEFPGANGHATARGLARMLGIVATGGALDGRHVLSPATLAALTKIRALGEDLVLPFTLAFGAGLLRNLPGRNIPGEAFGFYGPSPHAAGHSGWGGSCAFADPSASLSFAYVMNRQSAHLIGDPRPMRLIRAVYDCL
jgi:CubicO group peptidase (beta-lactamase class C family)